MSVVEIKAGRRRRRSFTHHLDTTLVRMKEKRVETKNSTGVFFFQAAPYEAMFRSLRVLECQQTTRSRSASSWTGTHWVSSISRSLLKTGTWVT